MARKLFISFLGTTFYQKCIYHDGDFNCTPTRFIQTATLERLITKGDKTDAVRIFVTDRAFADNWDKTQNTRINPRTKEIEDYVHLQTELESLLGSNVVKGVKVPDGSNEEQMWQIFDIVYNEIEKGDELYVDLTHAFRYLPMLLLVLCNYSKFLKDINVKWMSYGNWEARDRDNRSPIVNLLPITMLQDWTSAASEFLRHGYAGQLKDVIKNKLTPLLKDNTLRTENVTNVNKLGAMLESFVEERFTCRGIDIAKGLAASNLRNQLDKIEDTGIVALNPIFHKLKTATVVPNDVPSRCYSAAEWCYKRQLYQQAITILQEGINSFFCLRNGINIDDEVRRDYVGRAFKMKSVEFAPGGKKTSDVNVIDNVYMKSLLNDELINKPEVVNHYVDLSGTRNDYNHSGFRSTRQPLKPQQIKQKIEKKLEFFHDILVGEEPQKEHDVQKKILLNISNHPSSAWSKQQLEAAQKYGEVIDMSFPDISSSSTKSDIATLAEDRLKKIIDSYADTVITAHIMGEMTFTYQLVTLLKSKGICCVASCTERVVQDLGNGKRVSQFCFEKFREY